MTAKFFSGEVLTLLRNFAPYVIRNRQRIIIVEQNDDAHGDLALALLSRGLPLVKLDAQAGQGTLLTRRKLPILGVEDMIRLLEQIIVPTSDS